MLQFTSTNSRLLDKLAEEFNLNREQINLVSVVAMSNGQNLLEFCDIENKEIATFDFCNSSFSLRDRNFVFHFFTRDKSFTIEIPIC